LPAVSEQDLEQGTYRGPRPAAARTSDAEGRWPPEASRWLIAAAVLLAAAAIAGLGVAYLVANMRAVPPPDAAFLPTATPSRSAPPTMSPSPSAIASATVSPTATPSPSGPTQSPTPSPSPIAYVVERGDTINKIALRFGVTPESIIELNELRNPNLIVPGQRLLIPVASASPAP
jgi:LysM repeat protein